MIKQPGLSFEMSRAGISGAIVFERAIKKYSRQIWNDGKFSLFSSRHDDERITDHGQTP
ncbi:MAG: hypothetical protein ACJARE_001564 [Paracoccaceae bacterium]|jgi:hypothetical protein